jgi:hypothetical protein
MVRLRDAAAPEAAQFEQAAKRARDEARADAEAARTAELRLEAQKAQVQIHAAAANSTGGAMAQIMADQTALQERYDGLMLK